MPERTVPSILPSSPTIKDPKVEEEGETITGYDAIGVNYGMGVQSKGARNSHEWQMHYVCVSTSEKKERSAR